MTCLVCCVIIAGYYIQTSSNFFVKVYAFSVSLIQAMLVCGWNCEKCK
jgi:hypothetical protein